MVFINPIWLALAAVVSGSALIRRQAGEPYDCHETCKGRKALLQSLGAQSFALAVGFLETGESLSTSYAMGDGKTEDAACFSIFKLNWWMMTTYCSDYKGRPTSSWQDGQELNVPGEGDRKAIKCLHESLNALGDDNWFKAQRYGPTGLNGGWDQSDIDDYTTGVRYVQSYLEQGHMTDSMTTWYHVKAV